MTTLEKRGWINTSNRDIIKVTIVVIRERIGDTYFINVKGHSGDGGNEGADELAPKGTEKLQPDEINLSISIDYMIEVLE